MIVAKINLFDLHQRIYKDEQCVCITTVDDIAENVADMIEKYNDSEIHLYGNQGYLTAIKDNIYKYSIAKYSNNDNIKIYINE